MLNQNKTAKDLFNEYRLKTEKAANSYNFWKGRVPESTFPGIAKEVWRMGVLAEAWGAIASLLGRKRGETTDYLQNWRDGE